MKKEKSTVSKSYFINVSGGTGLNFGLSSFISYIKENGDDSGNRDYDFYVCSPYYDIFMSNDSVAGVYKPNELKDFIFDAKAAGAELILHRLYDMSDFVYKKINYSEAWARLMNIPFTDTKGGTKVTSHLNVFKAYPQLADMIADYKKAILEKGYKNYAIMQFTGGQSPLVQVPAKEENGRQVPDWSRVPYDYQNEPLKRHYPMDRAQEFVNLYHKKNPDTAIVMFQLPNEPSPQGDFIFRSVMPYLAYYEMAKEAKEIVSIDSSLQHMTAGICKATVIWGHSKPDHFGYSYNKNIEQSCRTDDLLYFTALGPSGARINYIQPEELMKKINE